MSELTVELVSEVGALLSECVSPLRPSTLELRAEDGAVHRDEEFGTGKRKGGTGLLPAGVKVTPSEKGLDFCWHSERVYSVNAYFFNEIIMIHIRKCT